MNILARGSILFGCVALLAVLFYFQPKAEAKAAFDTDTNSTTENISQVNLQTAATVNQNNLQLDNQQSNTIEAPTSEMKSNITLSEARSFRATAYCLQGRTANGGGVRRGIVAADPRLLPLGTRIQVNAGNYSGTYTVADTGGAIKGRILDIWVPTCSEAMRFGRRAILVSVVGKKSKANA